MLATYSFRRKQDFWGAIQQKSLSLVEKIRVLTKSCKNPRLFDLFSGLTIGLLELFLDHQRQNFKQNSKVPKSAYIKNAQKTVPLTERLCFPSSLLHSPLLIIQPRTNQFISIRKCKRGTFSCLVRKIIEQTVWIKVDYFSFLRQRQLVKVFP